MLDILYTFDECYAPFAGVSLSSLLSHNRDTELRIFAITLGVCEQSRKRLQEIAAANGRTVEFIDGKALANELNALQLSPYRGSAAANLRLFFDRLLPPDVDRLLYLDCDTLVCDALKDLTELDLGGKAIGAVRDSLTARYKPLLGLDKAQSYYNSGVLLIDAKRWRESRLTERVKAFLQSDPTPLLFPDQDLLNLALGDEITPLPVQYNFQPHHRVFSDEAYFSAYPQQEYYAPAELQAAREHPCILHVYRFIGEFPWHGGKLHPDTALWDKELAGTPWRDLQREAPRRDMTIKIERILYRILPKRLFLQLFAAVTTRNQKKQLKALKKEKKQ